MPNEENLRAALAHLTTLEEHEVFYANYVSSKPIHTAGDLHEFFAAFKSHLEELGKWNDELQFTLTLIREQSGIVRHEQSNNPLFSIDVSRKLDDSWLKALFKDFRKCLTGEVFAEELLPKRYKTIPEHLILRGVDGNKLADVYLNYSIFNHPYVNYTVASVLYNAKNFSYALPILRDGIRSIVSYPIHYWNNPYGIEGATWMIGDLLYLLGSNIDHEALRSEKIKLLKLLFLYMTRYICMMKSNLKSIDFYSNRARLVKANSMEFIGIFGLGVNPDIQYISDMYLAYRLSLQHNMTDIPDFQQFMWDSLKMYQSASHIPNNTGGYREIEERTWMELVSDGEIRSLQLGNTLLKEFENHELNISNTTVDQLFNILAATKQDDLENFFKKINEKKFRVHDPQDGEGIAD